MEIKGFVPISLSDWDGKVASVIFLPNCNMRCPFCYNKDLVLHPDKMPTMTLKQVLTYLDANRKWIDGTVVTGGEPTLHKDLPSLCKKFKQLGLRVKLDTNGTNPKVVDELIKRRLVDYVAVDVKSKLTEGAYSRASGVNAGPLLHEIKGTIKTLMKDMIEYEFRTTVVPTLHDVKDVENICNAIKGCRRFALQNFKSDVETIDPKYQTLKPFSRTEMADFLRMAQKIVANTIVRG